MAYNILIVDDSSIVRKSLTKAISHATVPVGTILEAENGVMALERMKEAWVDLIFLDINMPIMNGAEFLLKLRQMPQFADTPVVIISTEGSQERREQLEPLKVSSFLRKPVTPEQITNIISHTLG